YKAIKNIDFAWCEVTAVTMNGVWKKLCPQSVHNFRVFKKVDEESKEVFSNLVTFSKKVELDLQEDFIELLAVQHKALTNEDLMESEAQRKNKETQEEEEVTEEPKRFTMQEMARGFSLFEETLL
ncbi:hypothetical protein DBR06_SOUSAS13910003, partial [Sousa chinensis]